MPAAQAPRNGFLIERQGSGGKIAGPVLNGWHPHAGCNGDDASDSSAWPCGSDGGSSEAGTDEPSSINTVDLSSPPSASSFKQRSTAPEADGHCSVSSSPGVGKAISAALFPLEAVSAAGADAHAPKGAASLAHVGARQRGLQANSPAEVRLRGGDTAQGGSGTGSGQSPAPQPRPMLSPSLTGPGEALLPLEVPVEARQQAAATAHARGSVAEPSSARSQAREARPAQGGEGKTWPAQRGAAVLSRQGSGASSLARFESGQESDSSSRMDAQQARGGKDAGEGGSAAAQKHRRFGGGAAPNLNGVDPNLVMEIHHRLTALTTKSQKQQHAAEPGGNWPQQPQSAPAPRGREQQQRHQQPPPPPPPLQGSSSGVPLRTQSLPKLLPDQAAQQQQHVPLQVLLRNRRMPGSVLDQWQAPPGGQQLPRPAQNGQQQQQQQQLSGKQAAVQHLEMLRRQPKPFSALEGLRMPQSPASFAAVQQQAQLEQQQQQQRRSAELQRAPSMSQALPLLPRPLMGAYASASSPAPSSAALAQLQTQHRLAASAAAMSAQEAAQPPAAQQALPNGPHARLLSRASAPAERVVLPMPSMIAPPQQPAMTVKLSSAGQAQLQERQERQQQHQQQAAMQASAMLPPPPPPVLTRVPNAAILRQGSTQVCAAPPFMHATSLCCCCCMPQRNTKNTGQEELHVF